MNKLKKYAIIKCPKCGYEYLPEEIYYPDEFLGNGHNIIRDENGKIIYFEGNTMNPEEEFVCDRCECTFKVTANVSFESEVSVAHDFSEDYSVSIYENRIELMEPETNKEKSLWDSVG